MSDWHFGREIKRRPVNLPRAALCFAREIAYPNLDITAYLERLAALASDARPGVIAHTTPAGQAQALAHFLFRDGPLRGNLMGYADPRNSYLNQVLDRGMGIPISLCVIYLAVAAHLNLPAHGVNLPGHFIVGLDSGDGMIYLDPFHGGQQLTLTDCARLVRQTTGYRGPLQPEWLTPGRGTHHPQPHAQQPAPHLQSAAKLALHPGRPGTAAPARSRPPRPPA